VSEREVPTTTIETLASRWNLPFYETSAKRNWHINDIFEDLLRQMRVRYYPDAAKRRRRCCQRAHASLCEPAMPAYAFNVSHSTTLIYFVDPSDRRPSVPNAVTNIPQYRRLCRYMNQSSRVFTISPFCFACNRAGGQISGQSMGNNGLFCIYTQALLQFSVCGGMYERKPYFAP
jgi:hypothetical protein